MVRHADFAGCDRFLLKESFAVLAKMGYAKEEPRHGPQKYHGIAARTRLSIAGKRTMASTAQHRHQHHKERVTIQQVNDLAEIGREIESFTKAGRYVPAAVWEKYDRVNKRHKKHEKMVAVAADMRETRRRRVIRTRLEREASEERRLACDLGTTHPDGDCQSEPETLGLPSSQLSLKQRSERHRAVVARPPFHCGGEGCTFGSGRGNDDERQGALHPAGTRITTAPMRSNSSPWGRHERQKLNELYWEIGRPPHRGADTAREHFNLYSRRHCMLFPRRSPKEVVERVKLMFRYNAMKEPNEREHWLRLNASKGFLRATTNTATFSADPAGAGSQTVISSASFANSSVAVDGKIQRPITQKSSSLAEPNSSSTKPLPSITKPATTDTGSMSISERRFLRSGGLGAALTAGGGGLLSTMAASYAAEAIAAASLPFSPSSSRRSRANRVVPTSPFTTPLAHPHPRGASERRQTPPTRGVSTAAAIVVATAFFVERAAAPVVLVGQEEKAFELREVEGGDFDENDYDDNKPEETELLDYTSMGPQTVSNRATSPSHSFSRDGLGAEKSGMFQVSKTPEPGPGSFRPNITATSTHPGPRCGVVMGRFGSGGGGGEGDGGGGDGVVGGSAAGGGREAALRPGPGHYSTWDSIGRQILSTRPSSPTSVFGTGEWELR